MEDSRKNNDCYFYYYSTCLKGDDCTFRHEPAARGSETVCSFWAQGKCANTSCNFRHMELKKNRKTIPCYWESQPSGCRKSHCPFQHKGSRDVALPDNDLSNDCDASAAAKPTERPDFRHQRPPHNEGRDSSDDGSRRGGGQEFAPVDPVVVRFEEESDSESAAPPSRTPRKPSRAATQEELHLLRIQAEAAAYYSYEEEARPPSPKPHDFRVLSLAEIRGSVKRPADAPLPDIPDGKMPRAHSPIRFQEAEPSIRPGGRIVRLRRPASSATARDTVSALTPSELRLAVPESRIAAGESRIPVTEARQDVSERQVAGRTVEETERRIAAPWDCRPNGNGLRQEEACDEMAAEELLLGNTTMPDEEVLDEDLLLDD